MAVNVLDARELASLVAVDEGETSEASDELLQVFRLDGQTIGLAPRLLCHRLGLLHKTVFCFIGAQDGRLLLQTRRGGRLDVAVGGHLGAEDTTDENAILREVFEELGLKIEPDRLTRFAEYRRRSPDRLSKPRDVNNELRVLFFLQLEETERNSIDDRFAERREKSAVIAVQWYTIEEVLTACDTDKAADGLVASVSHYLLWLHSERSTTAP